MPRSTMVLVVTMLVAPLAIASITTRASRAADECLARPDAAPPKGSHWYYRIERTTHRRCWFLGAEGEKVRARQTMLPSRRVQPKVPPAAARAAESGTRAITERKAEAPSAGPVLAAVGDVLVPLLSSDDIALIPTWGQVAAAAGDNVEPDDGMPLVWPVLVPDLSSVDLPRRSTPRIEDMLASLAGVLALAAFVTARIAKRRGERQARPSPPGVEWPTATPPRPAPRPPLLPELVRAGPPGSARKPAKRVPVPPRPRQAGEDIEARLQRLLRDWERAAA